MVVVTHISVPTYLLHSPLYEQFFSVATQQSNNEVDSENEEDIGNELSIELPDKFVKSDTKVESIEQLQHLLETLRYWQCATLPIDDILDFCWHISQVETLKALEIMNQFAKELVDLKAVSAVIALEEPRERIISCIDTASVTILRWIMSSRNKHLNIYRETCSMNGVRFTAHAADQGTLQCLKLLRETCMCPWDEQVPFNALVRHHEDCLLYAISSRCPLPDYIYKKHDKFPEILAERGYIECLDVLLNMDQDSSAVQRWDLDRGETLFARAAQGGKLRTMQYLKSCGFQWDYSTCAAAAGGGHLDCLKYAHTEGCSWNDETCSVAASHKRLDCLRYAFTNGCPYNVRVVGAIIASSGSLECTELFYSQGYTFDTWQTSEAAGAGHLHILQYAYEHGCSWDYNCFITAARSNYLNCIRYLHENGCDWTSGACLNATQHGHLETLKYLHEHGCPWSSEVCTIAVERGYVHCLRYAMSHGCPFTHYLCVIAARYGHVDCMRVLREYNCPWNDDVCPAAAHQDHFQCLKFAHENGCPWDERTCAAAASGCSLPCLRYAHEHGCPWDARTLESSTGTSNLCGPYARKHGCPST